jgi:thioredoxin reductase (NADPH)
MSEYDMIIIGGGPVGLYGAFYAGLRDMKVAIIEAEKELGGQLVTLYPDKYVYDVGGIPKIIAMDLAQNLIEQAKTFGPTIYINNRAIKLNKKDNSVWEVITDKGINLGARTVLVTVGIGILAPNRLGAKGEIEYENKGVYYVVKSKREFEGKNVLIVGGGDTAVDWALNLRGIAKSITLIHRRDQFRAHEASVKELFKTVNVRVFHELKEVKGDGSKVTSAIIFNNKTGETKEISVDAVIINIGYRGDLNFLNEWGLKLKGRNILVNSRMETNLQGVYAAGDIVEQEGAPKLLLLATGFAQAAIATSVAKKYISPESSLFGGHSSEIMKNQ